MSSIPDCVSTAHLMSLLDASPEDIIESTDDTDKDRTTKMIDFVVEGVDTMQEAMGNTFAFKLIADYCLHQLQMIHEVGYRRQLELNNPEMAGAWSRDAGQIQAMLATLKYIQCGPADFLCPTPDVDEE